MPEVRYVQDADAEIASLREINPKHTAVADQRFQDILGSSSEQDSTSFVVLKEYEASRLAYESTSTKGGVVVFSDIYYPGWSCTIDGKETPIARVNYVLRAIQVPAGKHSIVMSFYPKSVQVTETIAYIALALLVVLTLIYGLVSLRRSRRGQSA